MSMTDALDAPSAARPEEMGVVTHVETSYLGFSRLYHLVRNPLRLDPIEAYDKWVVVRPREGTDRKDAWVMDPALVTELLGQRADHFHKSEFETKILARMIGDGLLTSDGALWRWQRRTMAPLFRPAAMEGHVRTMAQASNEKIAAWRREGDMVRPIDSDMTDLTAATIMRTMQANSQTEEDILIKRETRRFIAGTAWEGALRLVNAPPFFPNPGRGKIERSVRTLRQCMASLIERKRRELDGNAAATGDLIAQLIASRDPETGATMTEDQLVNNLLTVVEAGFETTATALTWTLFLLARHPEWQGRARAEVIEILGAEPISARHLVHMPLVRQVFKEAMRLYPPGSTLARVVAKPLRIADVDFEEGDVVMFPVYCIHRHKRLWRDPHVFDPTRFSPEQEPHIQKGQYLPFGAGVRTCIGNTFALTEASIALAALLKNARFHPFGPKNPEPVSRVTLRPRGGMRLNVEWI